MSTMSIRSTLAGNAANETTVTVQGWVRTRRDSKAGLSFIAVNDGSCFDSIQLVCPNTLDNYESEIRKLTAGCSIKAEGLLVESQGKGQQYEIQATSITVVGWVDDPDTYPMQQKRHSFEFLRDVAHLRPRTNSFGAITRVRHHIAQAIHRFYHENEFFWINTPIITGSDCEGAGDMFRVSTLDFANLPRTPSGEIDYQHDFFSQETFLTVSGQLNLECYCLALSKVYSFGPTFRAENSNTTRHLAEFWMIEPEIAFADLNDSADLAQNFLQYIAKAVLNECPEDMDFFEKRVEKTAITRLRQLAESPFVRIDYTDAIDILIKSGKKFEFPVSWGLDLQTEHERFLTENHFNSPVVILNYPKEIKAFYMRMNDDDKTVAAMDVLAPGIGEIIGGSQREERYDLLKARMLQQQLDVETYAWFLDLRRYGTVPHVGFGLGFERLVSYVTGMANVRDVIPFPRVPGNAKF